MKALLSKYWYVLCVLPFLGFWTYGLTDLDEGFYGAVTMDMLRRGDWITPTLNGTPWFEKPILAYWLSMPFVAAMPNEFGARLPSFLCTMATLIILYRFVKNHLSESTAILTCLIYSTSLLVVGIGRMMMTDAPLVLCLTVAFNTFYDSIQGNQKLRLITATALGFAVLAKGPVALILFGLIGIFSFWRLPDTRQNWNKYWLTGTLILAAIVAIWYVPCYLANGQTFIDKFLIEQNIGRFKGGDTAHAITSDNPFYFPSFILFYPLTLTLSSLFWIVPATRAKWWKTTNTDQSKNPLLTYLMIWFLVVLIFFSISSTKLVHYVLPCVPPLAILIANALLTRHPKFVQPVIPDSIRDPQLVPTPPLPPGEGLREGIFNRYLLPAAIASVASLALSQYAFYTDWSKRFKDVQSFAIEARNKNLQLYEYNIGRPAGANTTVELTLNNTGHPSLGFYYRQPILDYPSDPLEPKSMIIGREHAFDHHNTLIGAVDYQHRGGYAAAIIDR